MVQERVREQEENEFEGEGDEEQDYGQSRVVEGKGNRQRTLEKKSEELVEVAQLFVLHCLEETEQFLSEVRLSKEVLPEVVEEEQNGHRAIKRQVNYRNNEGANLEGSLRPSESQVRKAQKDGRIREGSELENQDIVLELPP